MFHEDAPRAKSAGIVPGEDLSAFSVEDLEERLELLKAELARTEAKIVEKKKGLAAADAVFRTGG
ncbi:DUF1192 family protein [Marinicauda algicola]|uniref:DUF1192 family protein n=1 Tax=Marinicauda algicola TaxID=2029849 RepID=A0A4S2H1H1_9PROT|nr:DUF1192 family protein [Marinicauda algicola]TGY89273.1 DUF1192 family protein [Marinicauda algicola]